MFVLDTNVVSELMRAHPSKAVVKWIGKTPTASLFTTTVCMAEILYGVSLLPRGKRRRGIEAAAEQMFAEDFEGRVLSFDSAAAREFARIASTRRAGGRPISHADAQIAAVTASRGGTLVTRNTADFDDTAVPLVDPFRG